jgi:tetratricopeptide (TPR) repeat protein
MLSVSDPAGRRGETRPVQWKPFRRSAVKSPDEQLAEQAESAEIAYHAGRYELARADFDAVVTEYWQQLVDRPEDVELTDRLAAGLNGLALCLEKLHLFDEATAVHAEAVETSRRAVELRRAAGSGAADTSLARTLRTFALVRANVGVELDEAEKALEEAMALNMAALTAGPSEEQLAESYATELVQAQLLARQGRHVEAARVADLARSGHLDGLVEMLRARSARPRGG